MSQAFATTVEAISYDPTVTRRIVSIHHRRYNNSTLLYNHFIDLDTSIPILQHTLRLLFYSKFRGKSFRSWCDWSADRSLMVDPSFQSVLHDWSNKGRGVCNPCWMVHIKETLLLIGKSRPCCDGSGFPLLQSGPLPYVRRHITVMHNVLSASLNKTFPFLFIFLRRHTAVSKMCWVHR